MKIIKSIVTCVFLTSLGSISAGALANDSIDPDDFVDEASAKGIAEIESGKLALQKSNSKEVRAFAQQMINDHTAANNDLAAIARKKNLKLESEAELTNKAKEFMLKQHDGESFDVAYAKNQVSAHEDAIKLFEKESKASDAELSAYARTTLPKLQRHLEQAHQLEAKTTTVKMEKVK